MLDENSPDLFWHDVLIYTTTTISQNLCVVIIRSLAHFCCSLKVRWSTFHSELIFTTSLSSVLYSPLFSSILFTLPSNYPAIGLHSPEYLSHHIITWSLIRDKETDRNNQVCWVLRTDLLLSFNNKLIHETLFFHTHCWYLPLIIAPTAAGNRNEFSRKKTPEGIWVSEGES